MHDHDNALKAVLKGLSASAFRLVTGADEVVNWPSAEPLQARSPKADLLGETADHCLLHIELQSSNDSTMAVRMLEYAVAIRRAFGQFPRQVVLYTGRRRLKMPDRLDETDLTFRYRMVDLRELDGEPLLASARLEDNVIAVLMRLADQRVAVRRILSRIAASEPELREKALADLATLAGLRELGAILKSEVTGMPILDDIMDHDLFGPKIREGMAKGRAVGLEEGRREGRKEGEGQLIRRLIEKRFGPVPVWVDQRLEAMTLPETENVALRLLDAESLQELLG